MPLGRDDALLDEGVEAIPGSGNPNLLGSPAKEAAEDLDGCFLCAIADPAVSRFPLLCCEACPRLLAELQLEDDGATL